MARIIRRNRRLIVGLLVAVFLCGGIHSAIARDGKTCGIRGCGSCDYEYRDCLDCGEVHCGMWGSGCQQDCKKCEGDPDWICVPMNQ